jgi:DNA polymerase III delta subunit
MPRVTVPALNFDPKTIVLGTNFLLEGTDQWLIDSVADRVRSTMKKDFETDIVIVYGDEVKAAELNDTLDTFSIFSTRKLIIVKNGESLEKKELAVLAEYLAAPSDSQTLLIITAKINLTQKSWKTIAEACEHIACEPPKYAAMIKSWLGMMLARSGRRMAPGAQELFSSRVELDYATAYNEFSKLLLLTAANAVISEKDVLRAIGTSRVGTLTDFYKALGTKDKKQAVAGIAKMLLSDWQPLQVFFQFVRFYGIIHRILLLKRSHLSDAEIIRTHLQGMYDKQKAEHVKYAANYTLPSIHRIFGILLETDSQIKLSAAQDDVLLTLCVLKVLEA